MQSLKTIRDSFHAQFLNIRNCNNLIQSPDFELAYCSATTEERKHLKRAIDNNDKNRIKQFIDTQLLKMTPFEKLGIRKLREIGRNLQICSYYSLSKFELVREIKNVISRLKEDIKRITIQSEQAKYISENNFRCRESQVLDN